MIVYLDSASILDLEVYLGQKYKLDIKNILVNLGLPPSYRRTANTFSDLLIELRSDPLFTNDNDFKLIDIIDTELKTINIQSDTDVYLYSSSLTKLSADYKKNLIKCGINIEEIKKYSSKEKEEFINILHPDIEQKLKIAIATQAKDIYDLINLSDVSILSNEPYKYLLSVKEDEQLPIFMLGLRDTSLITLAKWYKRLYSDGDAQLILSLLWTKSSNNKVKQYIIDTDYSIKSGKSNYPMLLSTHLLLWKISTLSI
jgi:hypothetical protein